MAFLLRNISYSADGRQIVRSSRVRDDLLKVGRDPESDIRLNDLVVALHHATIEQISATRVGVSAEAGLTVSIDGENTQFGQIDVTIGGTIRIGPFHLRVLPQEMGSEDVAIDIERAPEDEAAEEKFDTSRFALAAVMPGKRPIAWALVIAVLAIFVAWPIYAFYHQDRGRAEYAQGFHADRLWLSGSLSQGHAALGNNCRACHVDPFVSVRDQACTACHTQVHDHADVRRMMQARPNLSGWQRFQMRIGETLGLDPGRCVDCHTEHEGPQQIPAPAQQFCTDCHSDLNGRLPDTRLADAGDFEDLHPEFQPSVLVRWDNDQPRVQRVSLAQHPREMSNLKFPHALHLNASGGVAQMARRLSSTYGFGQQLQCADCHVPTPDGTRFQPPDMEGDCGMCHSLAFEQIDGTIRTLRHGEPRQVVADIRSFYRAGLRQRPPELGTARSRPGDVNQIRAAVQSARARAAQGTRADQAVRQVFSPGGACYDCHQVVPAPGGSLAYGIRPVAFPIRYMLHGWFDHRAHQIVQRPGRPRIEGSQACLSCHRADASSDSSDLLIPNVASCRDCHGGETTSLPVESSCAMCHDYHMDEGVPTRLLRQQVRGHRWTSTVIPVQPQQAPRAR
ncbi:MAG TPA: cytochrome c3 family protein [Allosphingosinicella sp.]|jgi:predicted CXXCH cytochrome family protein|nr:cytochrome c3 family protein [Allosphingosinicella sp.]